MADRFDLDAIEADDALLDLLAAGGEPAWEAGEHDPALKLLAGLRLAVEVEDELPVETIDDPESFLARCAALTPVMDPFARKMAARSLALGVAAVAALSVSGVAAAVTGDPLSPYEKVIEKVVDGLRSETSVPKEQLDGMPVFDKTKIVKVAKDFEQKAKDKEKAKFEEQGLADEPAQAIVAPKPPLARPVPQTEQQLQIETPISTLPAVETPTEPEQPAEKPAEPIAPEQPKPTDPPTTPADPEPTDDPTTPVEPKPTDPPTTTPTDPPTTTPTDPTTTPTDPTTTPTTPGGTTDNGNGQTGNGQTGNNGSTDTGNGSTDNPSTQPSIPVTPPTTVPSTGGDTNTGGDTSTGGDTNTGDTGTGDTGTGDNGAGDTNTGGDQTSPGGDTSGDQNSDQDGSRDRDKPATPDKPTEPVTEIVATLLPSLPAASSSKVEAPPRRLPQYVGKSVSSGKHSNGKPELGWAKARYAKGKHSSGRYAEGQHAAIARAHGSMAPVTIRQILGVLNTPMSDR